MTERSAPHDKDHIRDPKLLVRGMVVRRHFGLPNEVPAPAYDDYKILGTAYWKGGELWVQVRAWSGDVRSLNLGDMGIVPYSNGAYNDSAYTTVLRWP